MKKLLSLALLAFVAETAVAKALPPLGKRKYIIDSQKPEVPATIAGFDQSPSNDEGTRKEVMRDPIPLGDRPIKASKEWKAPERVVSKSSQLKLQKVAVAGRYSVPRVSFEKERKKIQPSEQSVKQDYQKKVQESEELLKDLNW